MRVSLGTGSYRGRNIEQNAQRAINLYASADTKDAKTPVSFMPTPGLRRFAPPAVDVYGPCRGMVSTKGRAFAVIGRSLVEVLGSGIMVKLGGIELAGAPDPVIFAVGNDQIVICAAPECYVLRLSDSSLVQINDPDFPGARSVTWQDGYFIFAFNDDTGSWGISQINEATDLDALDFATAEGSPDGLVAVVSDHRELLLIGEETTEVWYNSGAADFPFERFSGRFIEHGCVARASISRMDNSVFWLSSDSNGQGQVLRYTGGTPSIISSRNLDERIATFDRIDDAESFTYQQEGRSFYVITFPTAAETWVFDASTQEWHERQSWGLGMWRPRGHAFSFGKHLVGDRFNGSVYSLDARYYFEDDGRKSGAILRQRVTPHLHAERKRFIVGSLELDFEGGKGLNAGLNYRSGQDPQARLEVSRDGGNTWGNEKWVSIGKVGEYRRRAIWRRLGQARQMTFRVSITDPVEVILLDIVADIEVSD